MHNFEMLKCDIKTQHHPEYFHRQEKNRDWLLMCFQTPFTYYKNGKMLVGNAGDCIINSPGKYIEHGPTNKMKCGFQNDWMYFDGDGVENILLNYGLPIDVSFNIGNPSFMTHSLQTIMYENLNKQYLYKEKISCIIQNMLLDLSRSLLTVNKTTLKQERILEELRSDIFNSLEENWCLQNMADKTGYSVSRFCSLYKKQFNISPSSDLLRMRIQKSKNLLSYSDFSINEIAFKSGFSSVQHFSYTFKKNTGISPTEYRNSNHFF